jgi:hypothetical protein
MNEQRTELKKHLENLPTLFRWEERLTALRIIGRLVDALSSETPKTDLRDVHTALLAHAQWEREHGDAEVLAPGAESVAGMVDQLLSPVEPAEEEVRGEHNLNGETLEFSAYPLAARAGGCTQITNGCLEYQGYELGVVEAKGAGTVLHLRGLVMDNVTVQALAGALVEIEDCSFSGRYGGVWVSGAGSVVKVRESRFQTARVTASAGATLSLVDSTFSEGRDAAVSANGAGARVEMRGGAIVRSPVGDYGVSAYAGGNVQLQGVTFSDCRVAVRALEDGSEVALRECRVEGPTTKTVVFARGGGRVTLMKTDIGEEVRELSDCDEVSRVDIVDS